MMNNKIQRLWYKAGMGYNDQQCDPEVIEGFAELVIKDYAEELVVSQMQDPAFEAAMDRYYERKWAHRFD